MAVPGCPWCGFRVQTELYYEDDRVVVVRDLDNKGYRMRVLAVWKEHKIVGSLSAEEMQHLHGRLVYVMETTLQLQSEHYEIAGNACSDRRHEHIRGRVL